MPIEIKELHIRINVEEEPKDSSSETKIKKQDADKIIEACVEQVMEIISKTQDR
jgi:hypothetical protein